MNKFYISNATDEVLEKEGKVLKKVLKFAMKHEKLKDVEFNIIFVSSNRIHEINREYRNVDKVTDVISFALEDNKDVNLKHRLLGDIYICLEKVHGQALEYGHSFVRELCFLAVHGFYHLLGYDHMEKNEEEVMFKKQEEVLSLCNILRWGVLWKKKLREEKMRVVF